jgi:hypothetical protein
LASIRDGQWQDVQSVRVNAGITSDELAGLIDRQCLMTGLSATNKIYLSELEKSGISKPYGVDYGKSSRDHLTGRALLVLGLVLAVYFGYVHSQLSAMKMRWQTQRPQISSTNGNPRIMQASAQFNNAKETVRRLTLPWDNLFESIEVSAQEKVALLNVQPDVQKGSVLIIAEARNYDDMLGYTKRLSKTALKDVHILNHQIQQKEPGHPVRFTVTAFWLSAK